MSQLSPSDYTDVIELVKHAILSTDLAIYFQKRQSFFDVINGKNINWKNDEQRGLLRLDQIRLQPR